MANRAFGALLLALFGCVQVAAAQSPPMRVLYAEPFNVQPLPAAAAQKPGPQGVRLQAFNRSFQLQLEDNGRLLRGAPASILEQADAFQLLQGTIDGAPDSWVRLALIDGSYRGAIWDGSELYLVEPKTVIARMLLSPISGTPASSAIYRLSDTQGGVLERSCAVGASRDPRPNPLANYRKLIDELRAATGAAFATAPREIEVSMVGDFEFTSLQGPNALSEMLSLMNIVDGIFNAQVGVAIIATDLVTFPTDTDPFTSNVAPTLLNELGQYRNNTPAVRNRGLAHLLTGRDLFGNVGGVAFLGTLCETSLGVGLSEARFGSVSALIIAHELGHNFGAPHDGEAGVCASTPRQFLMSPEFNSSTTFSACSLQQMQPEIAGAACVVTARNRDVAIDAPAEIRGVMNQPFELVVDIASIGQAPAVNVVVSASVFAQSVSLPGATCTNNNGNINCVVPELPAGESRRMSLTLLRQTPTEFETRVSVSSTNDSNTANNSRTVRVIVGAERDFSFALAPQPLTVTRGEPFEMTFDITATGLLPLSNVAVQVDALATVTGATIDDGTCSLGPNVACTITSLPLGVTRRLRIQMISNVIGTRSGIFLVRDSAPGGILRTATFTVTTRPARDLAVTAEPTFRVVPIGTDALWNLEVRSNGAQSVDGVQLRLSTDASLFVDGPIAADCTRAGTIVECNLGTIAGGAVLPIPIRVRSDVALATEVIAEIILPIPDEVTNNDALNLSFDARVPDEVTLQVQLQGLPIFDTRLATLHASVISRGASPSVNVRTAVALPIGFSILTASVGGAPCTLDSSEPHLATCTLAQLPALDQRALRVEYVAPAPGVFVGSVSVSSNGDADPSNNSQNVTLTVSPNVDGRVLGPTTQRPVRVDVPTDFVFTVETNKYTLPDATLVLQWFGNEISVSVIGHACTNAFARQDCVLGTIPPNTSLPITVRVQGVSLGSAWIHAALLSPGETNFSNNAAQTDFPIVAPADLAVTLPQTTVSATIGTPASVVADVNVLMPGALNAFVEFDVDMTRVQNPGVLGTAVCGVLIQGMRCPIGFLGTSGPHRVTLAFMPQGTGPLPIVIRVGALNDFNDANDVQTVTVNVQAPAPPPPPPPSPPSSSGGGGGGGGNLGWLTAALLLLLLRTVRRASVRHVPSG